MTASQKAFKNGEYVFREGEASNCAYVVVSGTVEVTLLTPEGPVVLAKLGSGEMFGEMGLIGEATRSASVRALGPVVVRVIDRNTFGDFLKENPGGMLAVTKNLVDRIRSVNTILQQDEGAAKAAEPSHFEKRWLWLGKARKYLRPRRRAQRVGVQHLPPWLAIEERPTAGWTQTLLYALVAFVVVGLTWASLASLDRVVSARGKIMASAPKIAIQHQESATIRTIHVRNGDHVSEGQVLVTLDSTFAEADLNATENSIEALSARVARLEAELSHAGPETLLGDSPQIALQRSLLQKREDEFNAQIRAHEAEAQRLRSQIETSTTQIHSLEGELKALGDLVKMRVMDMETGGGTRMQWLDAQRQYLEVEGKLYEARNKPVQLRQSLSAAEAQRKAYVNERSSRVTAELSEAKEKLNTAMQEQIKQKRRHALVEMRAPTEAIVLDVPERATGSVVSPAEKIMTLMPVNVPLEVEVRLSPKDIGYVRKGDLARIKLDSLPFQEHGTLKGRVSVISENTLLKEDAEEQVVAQEEEGRQRPQSTYIATVELVGSYRDQLRLVPSDFRLIPGTRVAAEIKVGRRSFISYFLYPIIKSLDEGMRTP